MNNPFRNSKRIVIMGILNVTPDSFSDGGKYGSAEIAARAALTMIEDGADIIDIGGESTRPGFEAVSASEELDRVLPVIKLLAAQTEIPLSIDTSKSEVARQALDAGCTILNDITGLQGDEEMAKVVSKKNAFVVIMFNYELFVKKHPTKLDQGIISCAREFLLESIAIAHQAGITDDKIILDPGIGFGTNRTQEMTLIENLGELSFNVKYPILLACSRKRIARLNQDVGEDIDVTSAKLAQVGIDNGADAVRVHNITTTLENLRR